MNDFLFQKLVARVIPTLTAPTSCATKFRLLPIKKNTTSTFNTMQLLQVCLRELRLERSTTTPSRHTLIPTTLPLSPSPSRPTIACMSNTLTWIIRAAGLVFTCHGLIRPITWVPCSSVLTTTATPTVTALHSSSNNQRHPKTEAILPNLMSHLHRAAHRCIRRYRRQPKSLSLPARISPTAAAAAVAVTATATVPLVNRLNISRATRSFTHR